MSFKITHLKESFQQNGYVVVPNFLDSNELRIVRENIERLIEITHQKRNCEHAFYANKHDKSSLKQLHRIEEDDFFKTYLLQFGEVALVSFCRACWHKKHAHNYVFDE